ncbi:tRNA lysidine(34) synthetase TilS [Asticcacaulis sp. EMRT-3]|uniref:tRNA lysidine(34) synthetase TilS n=1 Tax=Asticcacaulis sp. EMRT-3 TaxID=3040349 RepID=UPI0024AF6672|nr:tRNA lysidine(34) synthetase TilS [Asticcacaulis sp. EMRT-3]MDI7775279.1 tRNA lysidine(34) synthetase TilS [Asticcacaulis sp. EMRT-3]
MFLSQAEAKDFTPEALLADFATRLNGEGPLGVAVSGGGDSLALLQSLALWGQRPLEVFCVDHGINPASTGWSEQVAAQATQLGAGFTALQWRDAKPSSGLAAAARRARHGLLAEAARARGCRVLCLGHTADDVIEARAMRAAGSNVGAPRIWSPSPVWPQGRGLFLYRPLLNVRRAALRDWLRAQGLGWIDDPANDNPQSLRARMRQDMTACDAEMTPPSEPGLLPTDLLYDPQGWGALGLIRLDAARLAGLGEDRQGRILAMAAVCAGGRDQLPRQGQTAHLWQNLQQGGVATLCGARVWLENGHIHLVRDAGDMHRRPIATVNETGSLIWDGRFELTGAGTATLSPADGLRAHLSKSDQRRLTRLPAALRPVLPVIDKSGPLLAMPDSNGTDSGALSVTGLVMPRFLAAIGAVKAESELDLF